MQITNLENILYGFKAWLIWMILLTAAQKGLATTAASNDEPKLTEGIILAIILGCVAVVVFCVCLVCYCCGEPSEYRRTHLPRMPPRTRQETLV